MKTQLFRGVMLCVSVAALVVAGPLSTPEQRRGRQIYLRGTGSGEITAYIGGGSVDVPGSVMACANCHAQDGRGKPESGIVPSDLTWRNLTKPYGVAHEDGRKHPAYTEDSLVRAIESGVDPAGNRLKAAMPMYKMNRQDLSDLIAYLKILGEDRDPGVSDATLTVATLVPTRGAAAVIGEASRAVLESFFQDLNAQGGVFGRKVVLRVVESAVTPDATIDALRNVLENEDIFAVVSPFIAGADKQITSLAQELEVPFIGPSTLSPVSSHPLNRQVFYLLPGIGEETVALASFAFGKQDLAGGRTVIVHATDDENSLSGVRALENHCRKASCLVSVETYPRSAFAPASLVQALAERKPGVVLFLGNGREGVALASEAAKAGWSPTLLLPGSLAGRDLLDAPTGFAGRVYLSFPMRTSDQDPAAVREYQDFASTHKIPSGNLAVSISTYSGAKLFVEALKISGREISRERLISSLEGLFRFKTGLTPPITFGAGRRIGASGAYVLELDLKTRKLIPAGGWIEVE